MPSNAFANRAPVHLFWECVHWLLGYRVVYTLRIVYRGMHGQIVEKEDMFYTIILWFGVNCVNLQ